MNLAKISAQMDFLKMTQLVIACFVLIIAKHVKIYNRAKLAQMAFLRFMTQNNV